MITKEREIGYMNYGGEKIVGELSCEKFVSGFHFAFNLVGRAVIQFGIFYNQPN